MCHCSKCNKYSVGICIPCALRLRDKSLESQRAELIEKIEKMKRPTTQVINSKDIVYRDGQPFAIPVIPVSEETISYNRTIDDVIKKIKTVSILKENNAIIFVI